MTNLKNIMQTAWNTARAGSAKFGGSAKSYFRNALRMAWRTVRSGGRKGIAQDLDRAAARAESINRSGATAKQCWFLAGLLEARGEDAYGIGCGITNSNAVLTKRQASTWIDQLVSA